MVDTALPTTAAELGVVEGVAPRTQARPASRLAPATGWALACLAVDSTMLVLAALATSVGAYAGGFASAPIGWTVAFGALTLALFRSRGLYALKLRLRTLDQSVAAVGRKLGLTIRAVQLSNPVAAIDVDKPEDHALVEAIIAGRR